jgi:hypothetical protein
VSSDAGRVGPWASVGVLAVCVAAAAIGSVLTAPQRSSTSSRAVGSAEAVGPTTTTTALAGPSAEAVGPTTTTTLPTCQYGSPIPPGVPACRVTGIFPDAQASGPMGWAFGVTNAYAGLYDGRYITVFAGAKLAPDPSGGTHGVPDGGGVRISVDDSQNMQQFLAAGTKGYLTITAVKGNIVTLQQDNETSLTFNLATDSYVY